MTSSLPGTAVVTGGAQGLGFETARVLGREYHVSLMDLSADALAEASETLTREGVANSVHTADITDAGRVAAAVREIAESHRIDVLVNNAGMHELANAVELSVADFERMMRVNVLGTHVVTAEVLRHMVAQGAGSIVNVSSVSGVRGHPVTEDHRGGAHYAASKGAVIAYTKSLAKEFGRSGIRVNCVAPGMMDTPMIARSYSADTPAAYAANVPLGRVGQPAEVAEALGFLASSRASYITGQVLNVCGGSCIA